MQFCMAMALLDRKVGLKELTGEIAQDSKTKALMRRVSISFHPERVQGQSAKASPDVVRVKLKDEREYSKDVLIHRDNSREPLGREKLVAKHRECPGTTLKSESALFL